MAGFGGNALWMFSGVIVWALHFGAVYAFTALGCARGFGHAERFGVSGVPVFITIATLAAATVLVALISVAVRTGLKSFDCWLAASVGGLALVAVLWEGLVPVWMVRACG